MSHPASPSDHFLATWNCLDRRYGDRPIMIWNEDGSAFFPADVTRLGYAFAALVAPLIGEGGVVAICGPTRPESLIACWGTWLAGGVVAVVDSDRDRAFVQSALERSNPALVLCGATTLAAAAPSAAKICLFEDLPALLAPLIDSPRMNPKPVAANAPGAILFTSGSTGRPKGVVLSRHGLWSSALALTATYGWCDKDTLLCTAGLYAMSGLRNPAVAALQAGATIVLDNSPQHVRPFAVAAACRRHEVSILTTAPALLSIMAKMPREQVPRLRMILSTGARLFADAAREIEAQLSAPIYDYYGLTETSGACIMVTPDMHPAPPGVIGRPVGCTVRIQHCDGGECAAGEIGELVVCSDHLMLGYLDDPEATAKILRNGSLYTGDMAIRHPDGSVTLRGRRDDRIKTRDGDILYPADIEARLLRCTAIRDVSVRPDKDGATDARLRIVAVPSDPHADRAAVSLTLRQHLIADGITGIDISRIDLCDVIPRTGHGKILYQSGP